LNRKSRIGLFVVALSLLAGCGGGDDEAVTKAEFIERADAICKKNTKERSDAYSAFLKEQKTGRPSKQESEELVVKVGLPAVQAELKSLSDLPKPEGEEKKIGAILAALEKGVRKIEADPGKAIELSLEWFRQFETMAVDYGFDECGNL
jgi:hypothetical protein